MYRPLLPPAYDVGHIDDYIYLYIEHIKPSLCIHKCVLSKLRLPVGGYGPPSNT